MSCVSMKTKISQKGVALIAVLWVVAFLATIASTVAHQSRTSLQMTKNRIEQLKLEQAAESAILISIARKINSPSQQIIQTENNEFNGVAVEVSAFDESGKVDLNTVPAEVLRSLMTEIGLDDENSFRVTNAILDWRDEDSLVRASGAEDQDYMAAGYAYGSKDADFERIEELQLVYGMTAKLYGALLPHVTVHTYDYGVNLSVASELVRRAVENSSAFATNNLHADDLVDEDLEEFTSLTEGYIYTFQASAQNQNGLKQNLSAVIRIDRGNIYEPFTVLSWQ